MFFLFVQVLVADEVSQNIKTWTSKAGTKIKASLISAKHHEVKLKTKEGKILSLHPHKLSEEDQEFVFTEFPQNYEGIYTGRFLFIYTSFSRG